MSVALLLIFLGLMALGVPIAISLGAASVIVLITMGNMPLTMVVQLMYTSMNSFVMVAVPLFILAGSLMDEGGIADKIYDLAEACVGWIYGGLGHVAILCNIIFGAMSGSSVAAVASIGKMSINAMAKKGYPKEYGVGINLAGCMLASVIPPSILMIVAASTASVSIGQALMAGMVPGVLIGVIYMVYNYIHCKVPLPAQTPGQGFPLRHSRPDGPRNHAGGYVQRHLHPHRGCGHCRGLCHAGLHLCVQASEVV